MRWKRVTAALFAASFAFATRLAAADAPAELTPEGEEVFAVDTAIGRIDYHAGRGLRLGDTRFTIGGFTTLEGEWLEDGTRTLELEGANFFLSFDPVSFVHAFAELEVGHLAEVQDDKRGIRSDPGVEVARLYTDVGLSDLANVRFGKFLTPIGRWNLAPAEPLVWTTSTPEVVDEVFDETSTGAMLFGSIFPSGGALSYSLYGTFLDPIAPDVDSPPAKRSAGAHVDWTSLDGWSVGASYFASKKSDADWRHLGGLDGLWRPHERLELSTEIVFGEGTREPGGQFGLYAQGVFEAIRTFYLVGRYERFHPPGEDRGVDLFDVGFAWVPVSYVRLKADYLFADELDDLTEPGFRASFTVLF